MLSCLKLSTQKSVDFIETLEDLKYPLLFTSLKSRNRGKNDTQKIGSILIIIKREGYNYGQHILTFNISCDF